MPPVKTEKSCRVRSSRKGAIVVLFALLLVVLVAMLALSIDVGYIATARTELQRAVDAGTLAGASALAEGSEAATATVRDYVQRNPVAGGTVEADKIQVELGVWDGETRTLQTAANFPSAIRVTARHDDRPLFFGRLLGGQTFDVQAKATAVYQPRDIVVVLDYSSSMNNDSELKQISDLGREAVEASLYQIYTELGSPQFGDMQWEPQYISGNTKKVLKRLKLDRVPYPYPSGSWEEYIKYVRTDSAVADAGYRKRYGYLTLVNYWLDDRPEYDETPDLWKTSAQPMMALKEAVTVFLDDIQEVDSNDRVGLAVYTHSDNGAFLETSLTRDLTRIETISRQRQAGHYTTGTNIGAGLRAGRWELEQNSRRGAFKMIVLMTDGRANLPKSGPKQFVREEAELCAERGYPVFTISLGSGADSALMQQVADITGGVHVNIPGGQRVAQYEAQLKEVFRDIAARRPLQLVQ